MDEMRDASVVTPGSQSAQTPPVGVNPGDDGTSPNYAQAEATTVTAPPPENSAVAPSPDGEGSFMDSNTDQAVSWTSSDFVTHQKTNNWYVLLAAATLIIMIVVWLLTKDLFATITVAIGLVLIGAYSRRQPRDQQYAVDEYGVTIGSRRFSYADFRSFSVSSEGDLSTVELTPLKRFALDTALYCNPGDEDRVIAVLSNYLPMEEPRNDVTDNLMRRLRF